MNELFGPDKELRKQIRKLQYAVLTLLEKETGAVTKIYYRRKWVVIEISAFGAAMGNMAYLGIGMSFGIAIGVGIGTKKDKEAAAQDKVLDIEI